MRKKLIFISLRTTRWRWAETVYVTSSPDPDTKFCVDTQTFRKHKIHQIHFYVSIRDIFVDPIMVL